MRWLEQGYSSWTKGIAKQEYLDSWSTTSKQKVIGIKRNEYGNIKRFKARLVEIGYRQTDGVDYMETYAPVASLNSIRVFLAVCCQKGMFIHHYDIDTAFLNEVLEEEVYVYPHWAYKQVVIK